MAVTPKTVFNNLASATVTSGGTTTSGGDNALVVSSATAFANSASTAASPPTQFDIVDAADPNEIMTVTNQSGSGGVNWAVVRGAYGTTRTTHAANWTAVGVVTSGALAGAALIVPPTSGNGRLFFWSSVGAPSTGTWVTGDSVKDTAGMVWSCTAGGTPGTWVSLTQTSQAETDVQATRLDQLALPAGAVPFGGQRASGVGTGVAATDAATLSNRLSDFTVAPNAAVPFGGEKITGLANGSASTDGAAFGQIPLVGQVVGQTFYEPSSSYSKTIASTTGAAVDTTNLSISFTALTSETLIELEGLTGFISLSGTIPQGNGGWWGLFTHGTTTQVGYWTEVAVNPAALTLGAYYLRVRAYIRVPTTAGTAYQFDWAFASNVTAASSNFIVGAECLSGSTTSTANIGPLVMRAIAA